MSTQNIEYIKSDIYDDLKAMTTVVGIKCGDGIIIASDSQATSNTEKIWK